MEEFEALSQALSDAGVVVHRFFSPEGCADGVWPNNWLATIPDDEGGPSTLPLCLI